MSEICRLAVARKTQRAQLVGDWLSGAQLTLYSGAIPTMPDTALSDQVVLAEFMLPIPSGDAADGVFTLAAGTDPATVLTTGIATFGRLVDAADAVIGDFDVGLLGSGNVLILDNINLVEGALVSILSFTLSEG
ncbi:hypothetical protein HUU62_08635 [Rhodoferax sp. 4810]|uniref:Uncharacterized protein n=1 Tax=Thiospirillum jenense TaxID=1653858 RepID=A0A839H7D4_9GAMM|nr:hypothetical protein [Thiospirillum jenense]MBB1074475.1 hypothetical protein [Rhodoferax jenense]MBB1125543.1 hypothetical protein [Thiospirillum jenense]